MISNRWRRVFGVLIVVLAVAIGAQYAWQISRERQLVECQARINRTFSQVLALRGAVADADRAANRRLLAEVSRATKPGQIRRAEYRYLATQRRLDAQRDAHPYPQLPGTACQ